MRFVFPHLKSRTGVILLCNLVKRGVMADPSGVQTVWKVENIHPLEAGWLSNYTRIGLVKLVHILKTSAPLTKKLIACKTWTMQITAPPLLQKTVLNPANAHAVNRQALKPFHSKPAALRAVYYKKASTELPPWRGVHVDCFSSPQHQGAPFPPPVHITGCHCGSKGVYFYIQCQKSKNINFIMG